MAKVLLVDDERLIRNGLRSIVLRSGTFFDEIYESTNGIEALEMLSQQTFDLVITDIRMPNMDGLELIEKMREKEINAYTIVLSGYEDFKYAQKAIRYGIKAYLLKPVDRNELIGILKQAELEMEKTANGEPGDINIPKKEFYESQLKLILMNDNMSKNELGKIVETMQTSDGKQQYQVAAINYADIYNDPQKKENNAMLIPYINGKLAKESTDYHCFLDHNDNVIAMFDGEVDLQKILDRIEKKYGYVCTAGMGQKCMGLSHIKASYQQATEALKHKLVRPYDRIIAYDNIALLSKDFIMPAKLIKNLAEMLDTERTQDLSKIIYHIFDDSTVSKYHISYLEKLSEVFGNEIIQYLSAYVPHKVAFIQEQEGNFKSIYEFSDIHEYVHHICNTVMSINSFLLMLKSVCNNDSEIDEAIRYVKENYQKDLTMAEVANHISLNYTYFSQLFKEKTGINFVDYLKSMRIDKAKELLKSSQHKISEISDMVGYTNSKHFTTTFRALTGISPKEYRDKYFTAE